MEEEIRRALMNAGYEADEIQLERTTSGRIGGFVISSRFAGQSQMARQELLWTQLKERLEAPTLDGIVTLLTMTPAETDEELLSASG